MRCITCFLALAICSATSAEPPALERLQRELKVAAPPEHYPDHAQYRLLPKICNARTCFVVLAVQFTSVEGTAVRLAVFSESEHYLGSYVGLKLMPTGVRGPVLQFAPAAAGNEVRFDRTSPPPEIRVAGHHHSFQRAR